MDIVGAKVVVLILLLVLHMLSGLVPMMLSAKLKQTNVMALERIVGAVLCIGGGVLLVTVFIHIIPEVREMLMQAAALGALPDKHYPFAELSICVGYLTVYFTEAFAHMLMGEQAGHGHSHGGGGHQVEAAEEEGHDNDVFKRDAEEGGIKCIASENSLGLTFTTMEPGEGHATAASHNKPGPPLLNLDKLCLDNVWHPLFDAAAVGNMAEAASSTIDTSKVKTVNVKAASKELTVVAVVRSIVFVIAISTHNVFEGTYIGLQLEIGDVWKLFFATIWHSIVILFCISTDMIAAGTRNLYIVLYIAFISVMSPLGIGIGLLVIANVDKYSATQAVTIGILQGIAGGTLLYVTFSELLDRHRLVKAGMDGMLGFFLVVVGCVVMVAAEAAEGHIHGHGYNVTGSAMDQGHSHPEAGHIHGRIS